MKKVNHSIILSATDLSNHLACQHRTFLDLARTHGLIEPPYFSDPKLDLLIERGIEFENKYLEKLKAESYIVYDASEHEYDGINKTIAAMKSGADIIYQAQLSDGNWFGIADILEKVNKPSNLGDWSYEVLDTKLAKNTKAGTMLQIALYSRMIGKIQGILPEQMHVLTPVNGFNKESYRYDHFSTYMALIEKRLLSAIKNNPLNPPTYPLPVEHCDVCKWYQRCDDRRHKDDHLSLVAGLSNNHTAEIKKWNINTLEEFAILQLPLQQKPTRGAIETYTRLHEQARVQLTGRTRQEHYYENLEPVGGQGLAKLPEPSVGDIFFDFESDPYVGNNGLEYLFGWTEELSGSTEYTYLFATTQEEEKDAFEKFVDMVIERWKKFPGMHIYHYTTYETGALKRLMGKYATRENEIDTMLRAGLFIDLHNITRNALRASVERYSLKNLEIFYGFERKLELRQASLALRKLEIILESGEIRNIPDSVLQSVLQYNKEDCESSRSLRDWLEKLLKNINETAFPPIGRPEFLTGEASRNIQDSQEINLPLFNKLMTDVRLDVLQRNSEQNAKYLLAHMLEWYRREKKSLWWEYFRLCGLTLDELLDEKAAIAKLKFTGNRVQVKQSVVDQYTYPDQEIEVEIGDVVYEQSGKEFGEVRDLDLQQNLVYIKKGPTRAAKHPTAVFQLTNIGDDVKRDAILRIAAWVLEYGINPDGRYRAGRDLLLRKPPGVIDEILPNETVVDRAVRLVKAISHGVLSIQGPPGTGKSYTAAKMAVSLIKDGKTIGVTAHGHKVIRNLVEKIIMEGRKEGLEVSTIIKVNEKSEIKQEGLIEVKNNEDVRVALTSGKIQIAAGTAWMWSREDFADIVDYLIVDEAGQLALIDAVAISQATKTLILIGDPQQLKQPQKGSHPQGTDVSALEHILKGEPTIAENMGLFLPGTKRMHPKIAKFISEQFYDNKLECDPDLLAMKIEGNTKYVPAGLWFEPVEHSGNQSSASEEADRVNEIVRELTSGEVYWTNKYGDKRPVLLNDILIIAPYNAQVAELQRKLPQGAKIGTVDKFQGQEAAFVIYSVATSTPQDAPRGMGFLYSSNRLNVAVSRAKVACIMVANPQIFEPECKTPQQMRLANAYCRYLELAT